MSKEPPAASDDERAAEASNETEEGTGAQSATASRSGAQAQPEARTPPEWWGGEPPHLGRSATEVQQAPTSGAPGLATVPPSSAVPPTAPPPWWAPSWWAPSWGPPPWSGPPPWYSWGPGWRGAPSHPPAGRPSRGERPLRSLPWIVIGGVLAALATVALGVGIGYSVWGGSAPVAARHGVTVPLPGISPFLGRGGFLGVEIATSGFASGSTPRSATPSGAHVVGVVPSSPAAKAGIVKGDTITEFDTRPVASARTLAIDVARMAPGSRAEVGWVTASGRHESAKVTLASRPPASQLG